MSSNHFRVLRSQQVFEDLLNLQVLDVSSNPKLVGLSPRLFLKRFRHLKKVHLNNLPQIKCNSAMPSRSIQINCRWFKTLIYLEKRKLDIEVNSAMPNYQCDLKKITTSIPILSKCLRSFSNNNNNSNKKINSHKSGADGSAQNSTDIIRIEKMRFELTIEPKMNQLLFEGWSFSKILNLMFCFIF